MRRFEIRASNSTLMGEGVRYSSGRCSVQWLDEPVHTSDYDSIEDINTLLGSSWKLRWLDSTNNSPNVVTVDRIELEELFNAIDWANSDARLLDQLSQLKSKSENPRPYVVDRALFERITSAKNMLEAGYNMHLWDGSATSTEQPVVGVELCYDSDRPTLDSLLKRSQEQTKEIGSLRAQNWMLTSELVAEKENRAICEAEKQILSAKMGLQDLRIQELEAKALPGKALHWRIGPNTYHIEFAGSGRLMMQRDSDDDAEGVVLPLNKWFALGKIAES